jgi:MFS transporter, Spinster family, sphingosine-1-phosphate transporter
MMSLSYRGYLLAVLLMVVTFSGADGAALGLVLQDIKSDLHLNDTQLGALTAAFAVTFSLLGLPMARWVDRGNRITILSLTNTLWSVALLLCSLVANFWQLLFIRIGVAAGQAGCQSPAYSLVPDHFDRAERPRAMATYMLGGSLSYVVGYYIAGWLNVFYGWRVMFFLLGLPGLAVAALAWFTLKDPRQGRPVVEKALVETRNALSPSLQPSLKEVGRTLWAITTFRHLVAYSSVLAFLNCGILAWQPTFLIRSFGLRTGELGAWLALIYGVGGMAGTYLGGTWASRHATNNEGLQFKANSMVCVCLAFVSVGLYLSTRQYQAFVFLAINTVAGATATGPLFAAIQTLVPERMRATSVALITLGTGLIGMGLGPFAVGSLSDAVQSWAGDRSLRYALLFFCPGYFWAAWHLWQASRSVTRDMAESPEELGSPLGIGVGHAPS